MPTLRQMQRLFSTAARTGRAQRTPGVAILADFLGYGSGIKKPAAKADGSISDICPCAECAALGNLPRVNRWVDQMTRRFGPNADLKEVIEKLLQEQSGQQGQDQQGQDQQGQGRQGQGRQGQGQQGQDQQGQDQQGQDQQGQDQQGQDQQGQGRQGQDQPSQPDPVDEAAEEAAARAAERVAADKKAAADAAEKAAAQEAAKKRQTLREQEAAVKAEAKTVKSSRARRRAKKKLRHTRRALSHDATKEATGVSLMARKHVSRGLARLNNVPTSLKTRMANLISRLVAQGGTAGEICGPIPVLSAAKLVKRLVVRRPLPNSLKEDIVTGRPVILFLPDISPSCAAQARPACDLANAAGYAGVRGSDVLVLPHFNGDVESEEEYIPWFNGRPAAKSPEEARRLFNDVCGGKSEFRIRVAVFVGDHDGEDRYRSIAENPTITRVLWLHNYSTTGGKPVAAPSNIVPEWPAHVLQKLSMVSDCVDLRTMLHGFDAALKMRK